jgi:hypothetical protein
MAPVLLRISAALLSRCRERDGHERLYIYVYIYMINSYVTVVLATYTSSGAPTGLSRLDHQHIAPTRNKLPGRKRASNSATDNDYLDRRWKLLSCPMAYQLLGGITMPV